MNRREFLKIAGIAGAAMAAGTVPFAAKKISPSPKLRGAEKIKTVCSYCALGCAIELYRKNGKFIAVKGSSDDQVSGGKICPKGLSVPAIIEKNESAFYFRASNSRSWEKRDEGSSVNYIAQKIKQLRDATFLQTDGGFVVNNFRSLAAIAGSSLSNEEAFVFSRIFRALGLPHIASEHAVNYDEAATSMFRAFGSSASHLSPDALEYSSVIIVSGCDGGRNSSPLMGHIVKARQNGAFVISVDCASSRTSMLADLALSIRPGTDAALFNGFINFILSQSLADRDFLAANTDASYVLSSAYSQADAAAPVFALDERGLPEKDKSFHKDSSVFKTCAAFYSRYGIAEVCAECGIGEEVFLLAAEKIAAASSGRGALASVIGGSFCDNKRGGAALHSLSSLHLFTGSLGRPGAGIVWLKSGGNTQGVEDFVPSWNMLPGLIPLPDVLKQKPESDSRDYIRANSSTDEGTYPAFFEPAFMALMRSFFDIGGADSLRAFFDLLPKSDSSFSSSKFSENMASGKYSAYFFAGCDIASLKFSSEQMKAISSADFIFVSSDSDVPMKIFDSIGTSNAEIVFLRSKNRTLKRGSFTDATRAVKWSDGFEGGNDEFAFFRALASALSSLYSSGDGAFPDAVLQMRKINSDSYDVHREISGLAGSHLLSGVDDPSFASSVCGNYLYCGAAKSHASSSLSVSPLSKERGFAWPSNARVMFNSLSFSGGELLKNADAVLEDDSPFAPGANGKPFALAIDSVAHLFHASGRAGALPASVFSPASSSDIFAVGVASSLSVLSSHSPCDDILPVNIFEAGNDFSSAFSVSDGDAVLLNFGAFSVNAVFVLSASSAFNASGRRIHVIRISGPCVIEHPVLFGGIHPLSVSKGV